MRAEAEIRGAGKDDGGWARCGSGGMRPGWILGVLQADAPGVWGKDRSRLTPGFCLEHLGGRRDSESWGICGQVTMGADLSMLESNCPVGVLEKVVRPHGPSPALKSEAQPSSSRPQPSGSRGQGSSGPRKQSWGCPASDQHDPNLGCHRVAGSASSPIHCARKMFLLPPTSCPVLSPAELSPACTGTWATHDSEGLRPQGWLQGDCPARYSHGVFAGAPSGFWAQHCDTSSKEPLFAFSLSAGAHLNIGMQIFLFLFLVFFSW